MRRLLGPLLSLSLFVSGAFAQEPVQVVTMSGGVRNPGPLPWTADLTLLSAIRMTGGLSDFAGTWHIRIVRNGKPLREYSLKELEMYSDIDAKRLPKLLPGDQVVIPD